MATRHSKKRKMDDEDLPRGGGSEVTPIELKKIRKQADSDFLFEIKSTEGKKGKSKKRTTNKTPKSKRNEEPEQSGEEENALSSSLTAFNLPKFITQLRLQVLSPKVFPLRIH